MAGSSARLVVSIGELVVDWISTVKGAGFIESSSYVKSLGGNGANVAIALARLGDNARVLAKVGDDVHGKFLTHVLRHEGVDVSSVLIDKHAPTAQCYVFTTVDGDNTFLNWPPGNAAFRLISGDVEDKHLRGAHGVHTTGMSLTFEPRRTAALDALRRAKKMGGCFISFDAGFPTGEGAEAETAMKTAMELADLIKVNMIELVFWARNIGARISDEEIESIQTYEHPPSTGHEGETNHSEMSKERIDELARELFAHYQPKVLMVTQAERGSLVISEKHSSWKRAFPVNTIAGVGAGDAFVAGFLHGLLNASSTKEPLDVMEDISFEILDRCHEFGAAVGAIATTHVSAYEGLPTLKQVEELIGKSLKA